MKRNFFHLLLLFAFFSLEAGKLEDFEREYRFLRKNWSIYNGKKRKSNRDQEMFLFRNRISQAGDAAFEIQITAGKCGIKGITIGEDYREAVSYLRIMGGKVTKDNSGMHSAALRRIDTQLALLKQLKFSVEERTFSKQEYSGTAGMDALQMLEKMMDKMILESNKNTFVSSAYLENLKKTSFEEFRKLAGDIAKTAGNKKLPQAYDLREHASVFLRDLETLYELRRKQKNRHRERDVERTIEPNKLKTAVKKLKFDANQIRLDLDALRQNGFSMEKIRPAPYDAARSSNESIIPGDSREGTALSAVPEQAGKGTMAELDALKEKVYRSESRMNGVSDSYYKRYRTLLTSRQADEMDREYRKAVNQGYPQALARANAVRKIHGKYIGRADACTEEELKTILKKALP